MLSNKPQAAKIFGVSEHTIRRYIKTVVCKVFYYED